ncbi:hypothetical protein N7455_001422 [Penicillium solitum]|uniref:uncharacterized protein n=1 Tax=Penicillium solitum TaxID=60172 RepID=UPI0032C40E67|nr:hypothetical protein N7536_006099 [Penicillium majusculum]KAJ5877957.1 hypothetical protein N7455_001422 [Penicillium solitum]
MRGSLEKLMEENERLRQLVHDSGTVSIESDLDSALPAALALPPSRTDQEPPFLGGFTWELPGSQALEEVQLDALAIRDLFEQYIIPTYSDSEDLH